MEDNIHVGRDVAFTNDALNRLIMVEQGTWSGSAITSRTFQELWTLTPTGNWDLYKLDLNGNNTFTDSGDLNDDRTHNKANELTARDTDDNGTDNYTLVHDAAGNLREDGANYKFTYDAFGRLRKVLDANAGDALVAEYWYNGLGYRIAAHQDTDSDGDVDGNDTIVRFIYDERWRVVATYHDSDGSPKSEFIHHNAGLDGLGGGSYIDSVILRDRDASGDPSVMEERVYFCQDWRHDVVAIVSDTGKMLEWVDYTPYGMPYGRPAGDTDSDYDWDATDAGNITGGYDVRKDANLDGVIDANDVTHANSITGGYQTLGRGVLSSTGVRNTLGYAGYVADANLTGTWHVRRRVFDSELGRWLTRDPWGYVMTADLYEYAPSNPVVWIDPFGLMSQAIPPIPMPPLRITPRSPIFDPPPMPLRVPRPGSSPINSPYGPLRPIPRDYGPFDVAPDFDPDPTHRVPYPRLLPGEPLPDAMPISIPGDYPSPPSDYKSPLDRDWMDLRCRYLQEQIRGLGRSPWCRGNKSCKELLDDFHMLRQLLTPRVWVQQCLRDTNNPHYKPVDGHDDATGAIHQLKLRMERCWRKIKKTCGGKYPDQIIPPRVLLACGDWGAISGLVANRYCDR